VKKDFWSIFKPDRGRNRPGGDRSRPGAGRRVPRKYQQRCPRSVSCLLEDFSAPTSLLDLPAEHHERIRHTNLLEHTFGESRRRVKVIGRLPGEYSCLSLVWAILDRASVGWRGFETSVVGIRRVQDLRRRLLPEQELAAVGRAGPGKPSGQLSRHSPLPLADPTLADAILDRLVHNAHRIALKGPSMRRRQPEATPIA